MESKLFKPRSKGTLLVPPNVIGMISGVATIFYAHPRYRITYRDGSVEEAVCKDMTPDERGDTFRMVSRIQSKRNEQTN